MVALRNLKLTQDSKMMERALRNFDDQLQSQYLTTEDFS